MTPNTAHHSQTPLQIHWMSPFYLFWKYVTWSLFPRFTWYSLFHTSDLSVLKHFFPFTRGTSSVNSCSVYLFRLISICKENVPPKVDIISILVMLENVLYFIWFVFGGARSSSVLIGEDGVVTSIYLACSMVVSLTFTSYLSFYKK